MCLTVELRVFRKEIARLGDLRIKTRLSKCSPDQNHIRITILSAPKDYSDQNFIRIKTHSDQNFIRIKPHSDQHTLRIIVDLHG